MMNQLMEILEVLRGIYTLLKQLRVLIPVSVESAVADVDVNRLMTRMAVIAKLGISERTYNRWVKNGTLTPTTLGNKHFYREEDLENAIRRSVNRGNI